MTATVAQMTTGEPREMIEASVERKLLESLGDPDEGLPTRRAVRDRLLRQQQAVAARSLRSTGGVGGMVSA
jgi:hypothetical protein